MIPPMRFLLLITLWAAGAAPGFADEWEAPTWVDTLTNPVVYDSLAAVQGNALYQKNCAVCHGATGHGDGMMSRGMQPPPADFTTPDLASDPEGEIFWRIQTGKKPMPAWGKDLKDDQIWLLVKYVSGFFQPEVPPDTVKIVPLDAPSAPDSASHIKKNQ